MNTHSTGFLPLQTTSTDLALQSGAMLSRPDSRIAKTAKDFEATFLSLLLKEMRQTLDKKEGGFFAGDSGDVQGGLFDLFLSKHLADHGGFGLATVLERQLRNITNAPSVQPTSGASSAGLSAK